MSMDETTELVQRTDEPSASLTSRTIAEFDADDYREYVEEFDITDRQAAELLRALWSIMSMFVEMGFDLNGVKLFESPTNKCALDSAIVESSGKGGGFSP